MRESVAIVTLGCGRNEVDSDQVAGSLQAAGYRVVDDAENADCVLVNTCTFIGPAREESIDVILDACDIDAPSPAAGAARTGKVPVIVIGCMAQRYGRELAQALPEAAAVVGFTDYPRLPRIVARALAGQPVPPADEHVGTPRRGLPTLPVISVGSAPGTAGSGRAPDAPPTAAFPVRTTPRGPWAYLKIAGGCDRKCTFCTIPSYRGTFASRPLDELIAEARWLVANGVREIVCVSENTTSWGKDLPGGRDAQAELVRAFDRIDGLERVRLLYLQPAELQPALLDAMATSRVVAGYYDLSLQHASPSVISRMSRSGGAEQFLQLISSIRRRDPDAVFRSSFILGFPGETDEDVEILARFLEHAGLDWAGFFTFSAEDGTPSASMPHQVPAAEARARRDAMTALGDNVAEDRARRFVGRRLDVLIEEQDGGDAVGRSFREAPETDGEVRLAGAVVPVGRMVPVEVTEVVGVDLVAVPAVSGASVRRGAEARVVPTAFREGHVSSEASVREPGERNSPSARCRIPERHR